MLSQVVSLAWQVYREEKRQNQQRFMRLIQVLLMTLIVTLSLVSNSIQGFLTDNLNNLLGADLVLQERRELNSDELQSLRAMSQQIVLTRSLSTTLTNNNQWQSVKLKTAAQGYPLQGELLLADDLKSKAYAHSGVPKQGEIWLDSRLLAGLSAQIGDRISIANKVLQVTRVLVHEPDRLMEGHNVQMRAMVNPMDFNVMGFAVDIIEHRYLVAADKSQIDAIINWQKSVIPAAGVHHKQGAHPLALFWKRTENFIGLASIILFFMAAIAMQQLTRVQMRKELFFTAVCQSFGANRAMSLGISMLKWSLQCLSIFPLVLLLSTLCHWLAINLLSETFPQLQWQLNIMLSFTSLIAVTAVFLVFQLPVWLALKQSAIMNLIHNKTKKLHQGTMWLCALLILSAVAIYYSDNMLLTFMVLGSMAVSIALILALSWLLLTSGEAVTRNFSGLMPFALYMMKQRLLSKCTQILGVGLCAFLLLFTLMLLRDFGSSLSSYQRQHDGNLLVSQASEAQMQDVLKWTQEQGIQVRQNKPYLHAKLIEINGLDLDEFTQTPSESLAVLKQSIRLHWTQSIPENNRIVAGQWWSADSTDWQQVSVEDEVLTDLGLNIGDRLRLVVADNAYDFTIVASHAFKPGAGSITFWVQMPQSAMAHIAAPQYHMASLELQEAQFEQLSALWQLHPSLRMVSLQELTERFDSILKMVTQVVATFASLILLLSAIVILATIHALEADERKKNGVIQSFGFARNTCLKLTLIEWIVTGSIAACGAILGTWLAGSLIYQSQFSMPWQPDISWLLLTLMAMVAFVVSLGLMASKRSLSSSVRELMLD